MRVVKSDFIPDRSRPGKTTTVTSDWAPRVTGGHATWMQRRGGNQWRRKEERNEERKKAKKIKLKVTRSGGSYGTKKGGYTVCAGNQLEGGESKMHRWKIQNVVLWK